MQSVQVQKKWNEVLKKSVFRFDSSTETISGHAIDIWSGKGATAIPAMARCFGIVLVLTPARGVLQILMSNMLMRCWWTIEFRYYGIQIFDGTQERAVEK